MSKTGGVPKPDISEAVVDLAESDPQPGPLLSILVVGTDDWAVEQACNTLVAAGHRPFTCHRLGEAAFPCRALTDGDTCPLAAGVQLVLDIRARPLSTPSSAETGVVCALRDGLPLVTAGVSVNNPFTPWASAEVEPDGDLAEACATAARSRQDQKAGSRR